MTKIRNIAILGHQSSGKTTLVETLHSVTSGSPKGSIEKKNTISDYLAEEQSRLSSVRSSIVPITYDGYKMNLIDVPGNDDFVSEAIATIKVVKGAVLVIDAQSGVQVQTIKHWHMLRKKNIPTIIYVNKMDKENIQFEKVLAEIREKLGKNAFPFCYPMGRNENFDGFINVVTLKARKYNGSECVDAEIYDDKKLKVFELHNEMVEAVAQTSEELLEKFFMGEQLTKEEIQVGLRTGVLNGDLTPVLIGSAKNNVGIHTMLEMFVNYLPNPYDLNPIIGLDKDENEVERKTLDEEPFAAFVFKTIVDPYAGVTSVFKVNSGILKAGDEVYIPQLGKNEKISAIYTLSGGKQTQVSEVHAGDIAAVTKVDGLENSMTLCDPKNVITFKPIEYPTATYFKSIIAASKNDEDKLGVVLAKIMQEDKVVEVKRSVETKQLLVGTSSLGHLNYLLEKMKNTYKLSVNVEPCKVVYRETIKGKATGNGRYVKQSGGSGFFGVVEMDFQPSKENVFTEEIFGGSVPKNYFPAVEKGFHEACEKGLLAGFPVIGVKATLKDGKYHPVDSNELAFKMAAILAFKDAYMNCKPVILEPIFKVVVTCDSDVVGDILSDMNQRRGKIIAMDINSVGSQKVTALVPESEILEYGNDLKSLTQGGGYFNREFYAYEEAPGHVAEKILAAAKAEQ